VGPSADWNLPGAIMTESNTSRIGYPIRKEFLSGFFRPINILPALERGCLCR
jgi:hypothetical protein